MTRTWEATGSLCKVTKSSPGHAKISGNERVYCLAKLASRLSSVVYSYQRTWSPHLLVTALQKKNIISYCRRCCPLSQKSLNRHKKWQGCEKRQGYYAKWQSWLMTKALVQHRIGQARLIPLKALIMIGCEKNWQCWPDLGMRKASEKKNGKFTVLQILV